LTISLDISGGDFGNACIGSFVDQLLTINNTGFGLLDIFEIASSSTDFLVPYVSSYPLMVSPGGSIDVIIRFQPTSIGFKSAMLTLTSNDRASPQTIYISGNVPSAKLAVIGNTWGEYRPIAAQIA
jgi:hypothetical protein